MGPPQGHMFYIGLEENMKNLLVDQYLVCSIIFCIFVCFQLGFWWLDLGSDCFIAWSLHTFYFRWFFFYRWIQVVASHTNVSTARNHSAVNTGCHFMSEITTLLRHHRWQYVLSVTKDSVADPTWTRISTSNISVKGSSRAPRVARGTVRKKIWMVTPDNTTMRRN